MTSAMRFRLWARQAPRAQVATVAVVAAIALVMSGLSIGSNDGAAPFVAVGFEPAPGAPAGSTPSAASDSSPAQTLVATADGLAPTVASSPSAAVTGSARAPSAGAAGGASGASPAAVAEQPQASDQGVSAETIKIAFTLNRPAGLNATGFAFGLRDDDAEAVQALVEHVNAAGGVQGRKLDVLTVDIDPTNRSQWQAACLSLTEDEKVFAVLNPGSYLGTGHQCYLEHQVPQVTSGSVSMPRSMFDQGQGYIVSGGANANRVLLNWAESMQRAGVIGDGKSKVGLLMDDCPEYIEPWKQLQGHLSSTGVEFTGVQVSCDIGAAQQQVPAAVLQLRQDGAELVLLGTIFSTAQTFMQQAEAQGWQPRYSVSDLWANNVDPLSKNFPPNQFDGAIGSAFNHSGGEAAKVPYAPGVVRCNEMITAAGLPPITEQMGKDAQVVAHCDNFFLFLAVMERLPVNFTRAQWAAAAPSVGGFALTAWSHTANLGPGKYEGGDAYAVIEWQRECTCWLQVRPHESGRF